MAPLLRTPSAGRVLASLVLFLAVVVGGCAGDDQQGDSETPTPGPTANQGGDADRIQTPGSVNSTQAAATAAPTEVIQNGSPEDCHAPAPWGTWREEPFESTSSHGRPADGASCLTIEQLSSLSMLWMVP